MKTLMKITLLVSLLVIGLGTTYATTTDELMITSGGLTATITDNGACSGTGCGSLSGDINGTLGTTTVTGSLGGWSISITSGTSNSPSLVPLGLDITSLTATCSGVCGGPLDIQYSDVGFSPAYPAYSTGYSTTMAGVGSTSESAYFSNTNIAFAETTLINTVGPFTATDHGTLSGGFGSAAPFSLTLDQVFTAGNGPVSFSSDGNITGVPEPGTVMLFGTVLLFCASKLRRRRAQ